MPSIIDVEVAVVLEYGLLIIGLVLAVGAWLFLSGDTTVVLVIGGLLVAAVGAAMILRRSM